MVREPADEPLGNRPCGNRLRDTRRQERSLTTSNPPKPSERRAMFYPVSFIDRSNLRHGLLSVVITLVGGIAAHLSYRSRSIRASRRRRFRRCRSATRERERADRRRYGRRADRTTSHRRARHALHVVAAAGNDGTYSLSVTFDVNTDLNTAPVMVQNRVTLAMPLLPTPVQNQGITIRKRTPDILLIVNLFSPDRRYDDLYLSNYALINARDELLLGRRRLRRQHRRPARLQRPSLARPTEARRAGEHEARSTSPTRPGGRTSKSPPDKSVRRADPEGANVSTADRGSRPADRAGAIRRHHREERPATADATKPRRGHAPSERLGASGSRRVRSAAAWRSAIETPGHAGVGPGLGEEPLGDSTGARRRPRRPRKRSVRLDDLGLASRRRGRLRPAARRPSAGRRAPNSTDTSTASAATDFAPAGGTSPADTSGSMVRRRQR